MIGLFVGCLFLFLGLIAWFFSLAKVQGARTMITKHPMAEPLAGFLNAIGGICIVTWAVWSSLTSWFAGVVDIYDYMIKNFFWLTVHLIAISGSVILGIVLMIIGKWLRSQDDWFGKKLENIGFATFCVAIVAAATVSIWSIGMSLL